MKFVFTLCLIAFYFCNSFSFAQVRTVKNSNAAILMACPTPEDFSVEYDPCNPTSVTLATTAEEDTYTSIQWDMGNGTVFNNRAKFTYDYRVFDNYVIKMTLVKPGCIDVVTKPITLNTKKEDIIETEDMTICQGQSKRLVAKSFPAFCWSPTTYLDNLNSLTPNATPPATTKYYFTAKRIGNNLIRNGDFSTGNMGFASDYIFTTINDNAGQYNVGTNPSAWNFLMSPCTGFPAGGNYLIVNGSANVNDRVWTQTIPVLQNTTYDFGLLLQTVFPDNPASLRILINNVSIGEIINAPSTTCNWVPFSTSWNSGNNTNATISIVNVNTIAFGNDFGIDNISFSAVDLVRDSVTITVETVKVNAGKDTTICANNSVQLNATGAATYSWSPITGLSNPNIANPIATPAVTTTYTVTGTSSNKCSAQDAVTLTVTPPRQAHVNPDRKICKGSSVQLEARGGDRYLWTPATGLSDPSIANPLAIVNATTTYTVIITDSACGTSKELKTTITVGNISVKAGKDTAVCGAKPIQLNATGATTYVWTPATGLSNPNIANPIANPTVTTTYVVTGTSTDNCSAKDTIIVSVNPSRFLSINPNKTICKGTPVQLEAMGGDSYAWYPVTGLSNPNIANPIATVDSSITYTVTITDLQCNVKKELMTSIIMSAAEVTIQEPGEITCATPSIVLNASGATRYEWRPVNGLSNPGIANPVVSIDTSTTYIVKGYTNNCIDYDTVTVIVSKTDNNRSKLEIPNAFTPNNDGNNDCFGLGRFAASAQSAQLSVYNRWGQRIFYTTDPFKCWDGTINGVKQDSGGYMYLINVRTFCGSSATKKGIALLLR